MHKPKFKIGDTVYIKKGELGSAGVEYNSTEDSPNTKIIRVWPNYEYPYSVDCSAQSWRESNLELVNQRGKAIVDIQSLEAYHKMHDGHLGTILKPAPRYVFSKALALIAIKLKETL